MESPNSLGFWGISENLISEGGRGKDSPSLINRGWEEKKFAEMAKMNQS